MSAIAQQQLEIAEAAAGFPRAEVAAQESTLAGESVAEEELGAADVPTAAPPATHVHRLAETAPSSLTDPLFDRAG